MRGLYLVDLSRAYVLPGLGLVVAGCLHLVLGFDWLGRGRRSFCPRCRIWRDTCAIECYVSVKPWRDQTRFFFQSLHAFQGGKLLDEKNILNHPGRCVQA